MPKAVVGAGFESVPATQPNTAKNVRTLNKHRSLASAAFDTTKLCRSEGIRFTHSALRKGQGSPKNLSIQANNYLGSRVAQLYRHTSRLPWRTKGPSAASWRNSSSRSLRTF